MNLSVDTSTFTLGSKDLINNNLQAKIAECAYFKAQSRAFTPGYELQDWLEAEQECTSLYPVYALKQIKSK